MISLYSLFWQVLQFWHESTSECDMMMFGMGENEEKSDSIHFFCL